TLPRLAAGIAAHVPLRDAPTVFALFVLAFVAATAAVAEAVSGRYIERRALRVACGLAVGLMPVLGAEAIGTAANLQFLGLYLAFWLLLAEPRRWWASAAMAAAVVLVVVSTPVAIVLAPLAVVRLVTMPRRACPSAVAVTFLAGLAAVGMYVVIVR